MFYYGAMRSLSLLLLTVLIAACATSPLGRKQIILVTEADMAQMGAAAYRDMQQKVPASKDAKTSAYVQCVAAAITREVADRNWEVTVFGDKQVNAFALPGGKIGVYAGLLTVAKNQDQLAAVIGHEIAHVLGRHGAERVSEGMLAQGITQIASAKTGYDPQVFGMATDILFLKPNSRAHESEADLLGLDLMAKAGFDPRQAPELWRNMAQGGGKKPPEMLSTHPSDDTRIRQLTERLPQALPLYEKAQSAGKVPRCS